MPNTDDSLAREHLPLERRVDLLERDRAQQSRMITEIVEKISKGFTPEQLGQIRAAMREELADAGLRVDGAKQQDEAREDFRFLRRLRLMWDGTSTKVGNAILTAVIVIAGVIIASGFWAWINSGGKG